MENMLGKISFYCRHISCLLPSIPSLYDCLLVTCANTIVTDGIKYYYNMLFPYEEIVVYKCHVTNLIDACSPYVIMVRVDRSWYVFVTG